MSETAKLAILFADISGSTALYDKLGNESARRIIANCITIMTREMVQRGGTLIKTIGDEIMCTFPDAASALEAACAMHRSVESERPGGEQPVYIRIGFHYGDVLPEEGDVFGDAVNIAAHVTAVTRARQIMVTRTVIDALPARLRAGIQRIMRAEFRGKQESFELFLVPWEQDDTMTTRVGIASFRKPREMRNELILRYRQQVITLNEQRNSLLLGRDPVCDLVLDDAYASRQHARIDFNFGKFTLTDHSANGTFVRFGDSQPIHLAGERIVLHGAGSISLGEPFADQAEGRLDFIVQ